MGFLKSLFGKYVEDTGQIAQQNRAKASSEVQEARQAIQAIQANRSDAATSVHGGVVHSPDAARKMLAKGIVEAFNGKYSNALGRTHYVDGEPVSQEYFEYINGQGGRAADHTGGGEYIGETGYRSE